jgi:hypothetical protein
MPPDLLVPSRRFALRPSGTHREHRPLGLTYVAAEPRVLQAGDTALVLTPEGIGVARRHDDRAWRYAIALLSFDHTTAKEEQ